MSTRTCTSGVGFEESHRACLLLNPKHAVLVLHGLDMASEWGLYTFANIIARNAKSMQIFVIARRIEDLDAKLRFLPDDFVELLGGTERNGVRPSMRTLRDTQDDLGRLHELLRVRHPTSNVSHIYL